MQAEKRLPENIGNNLLKGCINELKSHKIDFDIVYAPGCFEIPFLISKNIPASSNDFYGCLEFNIYESLELF